MFVPNRILGLTLFFLLVFSALVGSKPPGPNHAKPSEPALNIDRFGDPLPEGAIARLGTVRFRHGFLTGAIAYSPDGKTLASGGRFPGLRLWDAETGRLLKRPSQSGVNSLAFSPDSKMLLVSDGLPTLIDVASGKELGRF